MGESLVIGFKRLEDGSEELSPLYMDIYYESGAFERFVNDMALHNIKIIEQFRFARSEFVDALGGLIR